MHFCGRETTAQRIQRNKMELGRRSQPDQLEEPIVINCFLKFLTRSKRWPLDLLCIAAARPQSSSSVEDFTREGLDIVLSLDLSASMLSKDFSPNRLEASKEVAIQFVERTTQRPHWSGGV
jgi:hypothetical protein